MCKYLYMCCDSRNYGVFIRDAPLERKNVLISCDHAGHDGHDDHDYHDGYDDLIGN
jgi:hypothetical protein